MNIGAIHGLRPDKGLVWEWGHSDSMSAVEDCEKPQVQRSESGTTTQFVAAVLLQLKISRVCSEWTIYKLDSALSAYVLRPYSYR